MGWEHPPFLVEGPKSPEADVSQLYPCYLQRHPSYPWGPLPLSVAYCPSEELTRLPPVRDLALFSSNLAWPVSRDQQNEEEELQEVVFWGPLLNFPLYSC